MLQRQVQAGLLHLGLKICLLTLCSCTRYMLLY